MYCIDGNSSNAGERAQEKKIEYLSEVNRYHCRHLSNLIYETDQTLKPNVSTNKYASVKPRRKFPSLSLIKIDYAKISLCYVTLTKKMIFRLITFITSALILKNIVIENNNIKSIKKCKNLWTNINFDLKWYLEIATF